MSDNTLSGTTATQFLRPSALFLACILAAVTLQAEDRKEIEKRLNDGFRDKVVTLRNFYCGNRLRYDQEGKLLKSNQPGPWTLCGRIEIKKVRLRREKLEIEGIRLFLAYDEQQKSFKHIRSRKVKIEVEIQPDDVNYASFQGPIARCFLSRRDKLADLVPPYWKSFLSGMSFLWVPRVGISADALTDHWAEKSNLAQSKGVLVKEVWAESAAEKAGLEVGDVIVRVDQESVEDVRGLLKSLGRGRQDKEVTLTVVRDGREHNLKVELEESVRMPSGRWAFYIGSDVSSPVCIYCPNPKYTEEARKARYEGVTLLGTIVDETGQVVEIHIMRPVGMGLDEAAVRAVQNWRFRPAKRFGTAVSVFMAVKVNFRLY